MKRIEEPVAVIAQTHGPVAIGRYSDGTLLIAGPMDEPIMIWRGRLMRATERREGFVVFDEPRHEEAGQ